MYVQPTYLARELRALPARSIRSSMGSWRIAAVQFMDGIESVLIAVATCLEEPRVESMAVLWQVHGVTFLLSVTGCM